MNPPSIDPSMLATVKEFVELLKEKPALIFTQELKFLRDYLSAVGAKLPTMPSGFGEARTGSGDSKPEAEPKAKPEPKVEEVIDDDMEVEEEEPFPDLPQDGVVDADEVDAKQDMGCTASDEEPSEEVMDKSNELKRAAVDLFSEGKYQECIDKYTEAIKLHAHAAVLFAKRGQAYLRLEKPNACIKDCTKALELNPDSAVAYKFRGRAHRLLGHWEEAASDLRQACKIDFDEQADEWLKECQPNARKVEEWRIRKKFRDEEREIKQRKARLASRARAHEAAQEAGAESGAGPDMGDFLGGMMTPEMMELLKDPEVAKAFGEIGQNPANLLKYQNNPKVMKFIQAFQAKMGGMGGMPGMGGMGGGMPGMGGMGGGMGGMPGGMPGGMGGMGGFPGMFGMDDDEPTPPPPKPTPQRPPGDDLD